MSRRYSQDEVVATIGRLTQARLVGFIEAGTVSPIASERGPLYRDLDLARIELLCDLCDDFDLEGDALSLVVSVIDQLHTMRADFIAMAEALAAEDAEVRRRIGEALRQARRGA